MSNNKIEEQTVESVAGASQPVLNNVSTVEEPFQNKTKVDADDSSFVTASSGRKTIVDKISKVKKMIVKRKKSGDHARQAKIKTDEFVVDMNESVTLAGKLAANTVWLVIDQINLDEIQHLCQCLEDCENTMGFDHVSKRYAHHWISLHNRLRQARRDAIKDYHNRVDAWKRRKRKIDGIKENTPKNPRSKQHHLTRREALMELGSKPTIDNDIYTLVCKGQSTKLIKDNFSGTSVLRCENKLDLLRLLRTRKTKLYLKKIKRKERLRNKSDVSSSIGDNTNAQLLAKLENLETILKSLERANRITGTTNIPQLGVKHLPKTMFIIEPEIKELYPMELSNDSEILDGVVPYWIQSSELYFLRLGMSGVTFLAGDSRGDRIDKLEGICMVFNRLTQDFIDDHLIKGKRQVWIIAPKVGSYWKEVVGSNVLNYMSQSNIRIRKSDYPWFKFHDDQKYAKFTVVYEDHSWICWKVTTKKMIKSNKQLLRSLNISPALFPFNWFTEDLDNYKYGDKVIPRRWVDDIANMLPTYRKGNDYFAKVDRMATRYIMDNNLQLYPEYKSMLVSAVHNKKSSCGSWFTWSVVTSWFDTTYIMGDMNDNYMSSAILGLGVATLGLGMITKYFGLAINPRPMSILNSLDLKTEISAFKRVFDFPGLMKAFNKNRSVFVHLGSWFNVVLISPIAEELAKHTRYPMINNFVTGFISSSEYVSSVRANGAYITPLIPLTLHWICRFMSLPYAIMLHGTWNSYCLINFVAADLNAANPMSITSMFGQIIAEEGVKRLVDNCLRFSYLALVLLEGYSWIKRGNSWKTYLPASILHVIATEIPFKYGVMLHLVYNVTVLNSKYAYAMFASEWAIDGDNNQFNTRSYCCELDKPTALVPVKTDFGEITSVGVEGDCKSRIVCWQVGVGLKCVRPLVYRSCIHNEYQAVLTRILSDKHFNSETDKVWSEITDLMFSIRNDMILLVINNREGNYLKPVNFEQWLKNYPSYQRRVFRSRMIYEFKLLTTNAKIKAFVKTDEKIPLLIDQVETKWKKPRLIQGRDEYVTASTGPWFRALGKLLAKSWWLDEAGRWPDVCYASSHSSEELGEWYTDCVNAGWVQVSADIKQFDGSVSKGAFLNERKFVSKVGTTKDVLSLIDSRFRIIKGRTRNKVYFKRYYQVCSGDTDTSVGNSYNHGCVWLYVIHVLQLNGLCRVLINGDDSLLMLDQKCVKLLDNVIAIFMTAGFELILSSDHNPFAADFCSGRFWYLGDKWIFGPKIGRVLGKTFYSFEDLKLRKLGWLKSVCLSLLNDVNHIPILRIGIQQILAKSQDVRAVKLKKDRSEHKVKAKEKHEFNSAIIEQFMYLYDLNLQDLERIEIHLQKIDWTKPIKLDIPELTQIAEVDLM